MEFTSGISLEDLIRIYTDYNDESFSNRELSIILIALLEAHLKNENISPSNYDLFLFVSNTGDDETALYNSPDKPYKNITTALNVARQEVVDNDKKPLIIIEDGIYREHSLLRDGVDQYYEKGTIVWTDVQCRSVLSDEYQEDGVRCKVFGGGSFYHSSDKCIIPRNGLNLRRNSYVEVECSVLSSISLWSTNTSTAIIKNCDILFEAKGIGGNKTLEFYNCTFNNALVAFPYSFENSKFIFNECEIIIKENPAEVVSISKNGEEVLTITPDFDGDYIDNTGKTAQQVINEFVVSTNALENAYNRYASAVQIIAQPENMTNNELVMRECIIRLRRESSTGLVMIQKGEAPLTNKSRIVLHDITVIDETINKDTNGLIIVKEGEEDEEVDLLIYSLYTNANVLRLEKTNWFNFEYNFKVYPTFLRDLKDFYTIQPAEVDTHISLYQVVENGIGYLRVLHSPDQSIKIDLEEAANQETGVIELSLQKQAITLKQEKLVPVGTDKILISDSQDNNELKYIQISSLSLGSSGEINTMANIGTGAGVYSSKIGVQFRLRRITTNTPTYVSVVESGDSIEINFTPPSNTYTHWRLAVNAEAAVNIVDNDLVSFTGTGGTTVTRTNKTITINSTEYVHPTGFTNQPATALTNLDVISRILVNNEGHITGVNVRTLSLDFDNYNHWKLTANGTNSSNITSASTVNFIAGTNVTLSKSGNNITINSTGSAEYSHPSYTVRNITLTGSTVLASINVDSIGSVTNITTRTLSLSDIGAEAAFSKGTLLGENFQLVVTGGENKLVGGNATISLHSQVLDNISLALNKRVTGISVTGTTTKQITLTLSDSTTISTTFNDLQGTTDVKVLNTTLTVSQATNVAEVISGVGTINLHRISKTGDYNHLINLPDLTNLPSSLGDITLGGLLSGSGTGKVVNGTRSISLLLDNSSTIVTKEGEAILYTYSSPNHKLKRITGKDLLEVTTYQVLGSAVLEVGLISGNQAGQVPTWNGSNWILDLPLSAGEVNTGNNLSTTGQTVYVNKTGVTLNFRSIAKVSGSPIDISLDVAGNIIRVGFDTSVYDKYEYWTLNVDTPSGNEPITVISKKSLYLDAGLGIVLNYSEISPGVPKVTISALELVGGQNIPIGGTGGKVYDSYDSVNRILKFKTIRGLSPVSVVDNIDYVDVSISLPQERIFYGYNGTPIHSAHIEVRTPDNGNFSNTTWFDLRGNPSSTEGSPIGTVGVVLWGLNTSIQTIGGNLTITQGVSTGRVLSLGTTDGKIGFFGNTIGDFRQSVSGSTAEQKIDSLISILSSYGLLGPI